MNSSSLNASKIIELIAIVLTCVSLIIYTRETYHLRLSAERQVSVSQEQLNESKKQTDVLQNQNNYLLSQISSQYDAKLAWIGGGDNDLYSKIFKFRNDGGEMSQLKAQVCPASWVTSIYDASTIRVDISPQFSVRNGDGGTVLFTSTNGQRLPNEFCFEIGYETTFKQPRSKIFKIIGVEVTERPYRTQ
jgi:hypothetical protein